MKRLISITLLFIFFAGQINLTWADHFCMSFKVKSTMMLGKGHLDCGMGEMTACDDKTLPLDGPAFEVPECCRNDYYSSNSDDHFNKSESLSGSQVLFVTTFVETFLNLNPSNDEQYAVIAALPPLIQPDRQVLYQKFLL